VTMKTFMDDYVEAREEVNRLRQALRDIAGMIRGGVLDLRMEKINKIVKEALGEEEEE